ncbi:(R)-mandelonitrile lyase [Pseudomonas citronellolis]|uniref:(R)-mandelonitrile lyase n=1 Tax=Pseudomonas citronellolis TaxID=53408 RepID=UPI0021C18174|nr:cupin domain-containing protein [Pseudomonas citronellolis]UXJ53530.1 cupin domain-containing protein [Pseudomonas citronellolis]
MTRLAPFFLPLALLANVCAHADEAAPSHIALTPNGSQASLQGAQETFSGSVRIDPLFAPKEPSRASGGLVTFEPGARSAWHTHPLGQTLVVTAGKGWVQEWNGERHEMNPGDVVWIPPGVKHWHGATATTGVSHIAVQEALNGRNVEWLEKVSDEQYAR